MRSKNGHIINHDQARKAKPVASPGQREAAASSTKTQSPSPELLCPGGLNSLFPVLANGEPFSSTY